MSYFFWYGLIYGFDRVLADEGADFYHDSWLKKNFWGQFRGKSLFHPYRRCVAFTPFLMSEEDFTYLGVCFGLTFQADQPYEDYAFSKAWQRDQLPLVLNGDFSDYGVEPSASLVSATIEDNSITKDALPAPDIAMPTFEPSPVDDEQGMIINPVTGLPMIGLFDVCGNAFGFSDDDLTVNLLSDDDWLTDDLTNLSMCDSWDDF